jgi:DNA-binding CsgD family transcriptional regulator
MIGLAALSLLTDAAQKHPLLYVVDDAQWLDQASRQTLTLVARRLAAEPLILVFGTRTGLDDRAWVGLPKLELRGLADSHSADLLESVVPTRLDPRVRNRILAESRGNPLALIELGRRASAADLTFGGVDAEGASVSTRVEEEFRREVSRLPDPTRQLLLLAAAEPLGDVAVLWSAAAAFGIGTDAAAPAEAARLLSVRSTVTFRHPLVRSAIYQGAKPEDRRRAHAVLAEVTDPARDPDRRAWHRAQATAGTDEEVAAELAASADRAMAQGGLAAAAMFLQRSALVTPDPALRLSRELSAAETALPAGLIEDVFRLLARLEGQPLDDLQRARCELLRAQVAFATQRVGDAPGLLLAAARRLEPLHAEGACDTYLAALQASMFTGRLARDPDMLAVARAARGAPVSEPPRPIDRLMLSLALEVEEGVNVAAPQLRQAYAELLTQEPRPEEALRLLLFAGLAARTAWDLSGWTSLHGRLLRLARESGALVALQMALTSNAYARLFSGDLATAEAHLDEARYLGEIAEIPAHPLVPMALAALRGDPETAAAIINPAVSDAVVRGEGLVFSLGKWCWAVINNGHGRFADALAQCRELLEGEAGTLTVTGDDASSSWALAEMVEAAVRCDDLPAATAAAQVLAEVAAACETDWALGVDARSRALLTDGDEAEALYRESIERLDRAGVRIEHGRALLLYGEWLLRANRRVEARDVLQSAHDALLAMGVHAFADRAGRELAAVGVPVRLQATAPTHELSEQELRIARLAADGQTNPEIGAALYLSRHTVEWHLRKVFAKLDVRGRHQLADALRAGSP